MQKGGVKCKDAFGTPPVVFALRQSAAIFARRFAKIHRIYSENRKFRTSKSLPSAFLGEELSSNSAPFEDRALLGREKREKIESGAHSLDL
jgi:hypothetical protein